MKADTVESLIYLLESFDGDQTVSIEIKNGRSCICVHQYPFDDHIYLPMENQ